MLHPQTTNGPLCCCYSNPSLTFKPLFFSTPRIRIFKRVDIQQGALLGAQRFMLSPLRAKPLSAGARTWSLIGFSPKTLAVEKPEAPLSKIQPFTVWAQFSWLYFCDVLIKIYIIICIYTQSTDTFIDMHTNERQTTMNIYKITVTSISQLPTIWNNNLTNNIDYKWWYFF